MERNLPFDLCSKSNIYVTKCDQTFDISGYRSSFSLFSTLKRSKTNVVARKLNFPKFLIIVINYFCSIFALKYLFNRSNNWGAQKNGRLANSDFTRNLNVILKEEKILVNNILKSTLGFSNFNFLYRSIAENKKYFEPT